MRTIAYDDEAFNQQRFGGISRYICELASRVGGMPGWRSIVVAPVHYNELLAQCNVQQRGIHLRMRVPRTSRLYRAANAVLAPPLLAACRADLLHRSYYSSRPRPSRGRVVVTVHDMIHELYPQSFRPGDRTSINKRRCVDEADHVLCVSSNTAADLMRLFSVPASKITVTHPGLSQTFEATPGAPAAAGPEGRPYFLFVGQRFGYKNFARVLHAWSASSTLRRDFDLIAFGGYPFERHEIELISSLKLDPASVHRVTGSDLDLRRVYAGAHALVYASQYEGFGIPTLEAMSSGCPVVCSNSSSIPEVVGEAAEFFDPTDVDSIRTSMELLATSPSRRFALIEAGRARARLFSWGKCTEATLNVYEKLILSGHQ